MGAPTASNRATRMVVVCLFGFGVHAQAQLPPRVVPLLPPDATLNEELARVLSVRELPDGRVLITDDKENRLVIGDFRKNVAATVGHAGNGPGEYTTVGRLWPIGGDTTFMSEPYQSRWHTVVGDKILKTQSDVPALRALPTQIPLGANARREVFGRVASRNSKDQRSRGDSAAVVRIAWSGAPNDTVGYLAPEKMDVSSEPVAAGGGGPPSGKRIFRISVRATDQLVVFPDGPFAIVRGDPYRVDWCTGPKKCVNGPVLNGAQPSMSPKDREAYRIAFIRAARTSATEDDLMDGWPATVPPFRSTVHNDPADRMLIAAAKLHNVPLVTADGLIVDYARTHGGTPVVDARMVG